MFNELVAEPAGNIRDRIGSVARSIRRGSRPVKMLCVLNCYNEADILEDNINYMLGNHHDILIWDHGSDGVTARVLDRYDDAFIERKFVPRSFDFRQLYPLISRHLIKNYAKRYDWISWPDQDEILEGPDRKKPYFEYIKDVFYSPYNYIQFNNFIYWYTEEDDPSIASPARRVRRYSLMPFCGPRIRSWRASVTNIRLYNHNPVRGQKYPVNFNLRHYPARSRQQIENRLFVDRPHIKTGEDGSNYHYDYMRKRLGAVTPKACQLHYDDGITELDHEAIFNWEDIYGYPENPIPGVHTKPA